MSLLCSFLSAKECRTICLGCLYAPLFECLDCGKDTYAVTDGCDAHFLEGILINVEEDVACDVILCECLGVVRESMRCQPRLYLCICPLLDLLYGDATHASWRKG